MIDGLTVLVAPPRRTRRSRAARTGGSPAGAPWHVEPVHLLHQRLELLAEAQEPVADCRHPEAPAPRCSATGAARRGPSLRHRAVAHGAWLRGPYHEARQPRTCGLWARLPHRVRLGHWSGALGRLWACGRFRRVAARLSGCGPRRKPRSGGARPPSPHRTGVRRAPGAPAGHGRAAGGGAAPRTPRPASAVRGCGSIGKMMVPVRSRAGALPEPGQPWGRELPPDLIHQAGRASHVSPGLREAGHEPDHAPQLAVADGGFASRSNERAAQERGGPARRAAAPTSGDADARRACSSALAHRQRRTHQRTQTPSRTRQCRYRGASGMQRWVGLGVLANDLLGPRPRRAMNDLRQPWRGHQVR